MGEMPVMVRLHLGGHCIERAARSEFKRLMDLFFEIDEPEEGMADAIALLGDFIEVSDFPALRSGDERLAGEIETDVYILRDAGGRPEVRFG